MMYVVRPIELDDLAGLVALANEAGYGLTTLPKDDKLLEARVRESLHAFETLATGPKRGVGFLFVLEDTTTGRIVGTCGIVSKVGGFEPFYAYEIVTTEHHCEQLNIHRKIDALHLVEMHNGPSEIGSLFLAPEARSSGVGRLLSLSRFLFIAQHHEHFDDTIIAELRGVIDDDGHSPFWDAIGAHFFGLDLPTADYLSAVDKRFIADLMPRHPIYLPMLPQAAQDVIGQVHDKTQPARRLLESEGFASNHMVDIFEAGPVLAAKQGDIRSASESRVQTVSAIADQINGEAHLIATTIGVYRCCSGPIEIEEDGVTISNHCALTLGVKVGQQVRTVAMKHA